MVLPKTAIESSGFITFEVALLLSALLGTTLLGGRWKDCLEVGDSVTTLYVQTF